MSSMKKKKIYVKRKCDIVYSEYNKEHYVIRTLVDTCEIHAIVKSLGVNKSFYWKFIKGFEKFSWRSESQPVARRILE